VVDDPQAREPLARRRPEQAPANDEVAPPERDPHPDHSGDAGDERLVAEALGDLLRVARESRPVDRPHNRQRDRDAQ